MAPKRSIPLEDPPAVSSSEEEEETSSGEEGEEEEEGSSEKEETQTQPQKRSAPLTHTKPAPEQDESESDSESGSDSELEDKPANNATVKPIASKPMEVSPTKTTKSRSKPSVSTAAATKSMAATKRGGETDRDVKDSKRSKKKDLGSDGVAEKPEDKKKQLFQRLWSEDDVIVVLAEYIHFIENKRTDPAKDMVSFFDSIKKLLHFNVSLNQLKDKVGKLKKKFENHVSKGEKGEDKTFSKPHEQKLFDLSKRIWGSGGVLALGDKPNGKAKSLRELKEELGVRVEKEESNSGLKQVKQFDKSSSVAGIAGMAGIEDYVLKRGLDMLDGAKKAEMEEKWRKLHVAELELFLKRNELIMEQTKLILAEYKTE